MKYRVIALVFFAIGLLVAATPAMADGPEDTRQYQVYTNTLYLPLVVNNYAASYSPTITTTVLVPCSDDTRGALYRSLVASTAETWAWPYAWSTAACSVCESGLAYTRGYYLGTGLAHIPSIMAKVLQLVLSVISDGVSGLLAILGVVDAPATAYSISCAADAENICMGIALIVSLDDMSGGWVSVVVTLLVGVLTFYLGTYVIKETRGILDTSQTGGESE